MWRATEAHTEHARQRGEHTRGQRHDQRQGARPEALGERACAFGQIRGEPQQRLDVGHQHRERLSGLASLERKQACEGRLGAGQGAQTKDRLGRIRHHLSLGQALCRGFHVEDHTPAPRSAISVR